MGNRRTFRLTALTCLLSFGSSLFLPALSLAQERKGAGVVTALKGRATIARATVPQPSPLNFRDEVFVQDTIRTERDSMVRVLMGGKALITVRELSDVTIREEPNKTTVTMNSVGRLALQVLTRLMRPNEVVEVHTANAVAAIRGSFVVIDNLGGVTPQTEISVLDIRDVAKPVNACIQGGPCTNLVSRQAVIAAGIGTAGAFSAIKTITDLVAERMARSVHVEPSVSKPPVQDQVGQSKVQEAGQLAAAMLGQGQAFVSDAGTPVANLNPPRTQVPPINEARVQQEVAAIAEQRNQLNQVPTGGASSRFPFIVPSGQQIGSSGALFSFQQGERVGRSGGGQGDILIFGDRGEKSNLQTALQNLGHNVTVVTNLPADLSPYKTIWHIGAFVPLTDSDRAGLTGFINSGNGVYLTGERPCCDALNGSLTPLVNAVVKGGGVTIGGQGDISPPHPFNPDAAGGISSNPNILSQWNPSASGGIVGVSGQNVFVTGAQGFTVGGVWDGVDMASGQGRLVLLMDVNWLANSGREEVIENIQTFLGQGGIVGTLIIVRGTLNPQGSVVESMGATIELANIALDVQAGGTVNVPSPNPAFKIAEASSFKASILANVDGQLNLGSSLLFMPAGHDAPNVEILDKLLKVGSSGQVNGPADGSALANVQMGNLTVANSVIWMDARMATAVDSESGLDLATEKPYTGMGTILQASGASANVTVGNLAVADTVLWDATAPLAVALNGAKITTTSQDASSGFINFLGKTHFRSTADIVRLDASQMTIANGHGINLASPAKFTTTGNVYSLSNGSVLNFNNGTALNVSGGSFAKIGGSLFAFAGPAMNTVNITNNLCPGGDCANIGGLRVALLNGAVAQNVSITNPVKGAAFGQINLSSNAAVISVSGSTSKVTIQGQ